MSKYPDIALVRQWEREVRVQNQVCVLSQEPAADMALTIAMKACDWLRATLCKQNSDATGMPKCVCQLQTSLARNPICEKSYNNDCHDFYCNNEIEVDGVKCAHDRACHQSPGGES